MTSWGTVAGSAAAGFVELSESGIDTAKPKVGSARALSHEWLERTHRVLLGIIWQKKRQGGITQLLQFLGAAYLP